MRTSLLAISAIVLCLMQSGSAALSEGSECSSTRNDCSSRARDAPAREPPSQRAEITKAVAHRGCTEVEVDVIAASDTERDLACVAARDAFELLGRCDIRARTRVSVRVTKKAFHPTKGEVFGFFDGHAATVARLPETSAFAVGTPYGLLPEAVFYKSLVVHEVVHAVMNQNYSRLPQSRAALEYPSYAIQFASLPTDARERLLYLTTSSPNAPRFLLNDIILAMDPFVFATSAYEHFTSAADGCQHLHALLKGEVDFILTLPPGL